MGSASLADYQYNTKNGKLKKITYGNGYVEEYVYDHLENLIEVWYTVNGHRTQYYQYTYNADGSLYKFHDYISRRFTIYEYDEAGRLSGISDYNEDFVTDKSLEIDAYYNERGQVTKLVRSVSTAYGSGIVGSIDDNRFYDSEGRLTSEQIDFYSAIVYNYSYDGYGRLTSTSTHHPQEEVTNSSTRYTYRTFTNNGTTYTDGLVSRYEVTMGANEVEYTHTYDSMGNITGIVASGHIGNYTVNYHYDNLGQLIREDNGALNKTYVYTYDNAGNILYKYTYALTATNVTPTSPISTNTYTYGNSTWGDQLTAYNGNAITYDEIGNPLTYYNGLVFNWSGRQLITTNIDGMYTFFVYDDSGKRTTKGVGSVYTYYHYDGDKLVAEYWDDCAIVYIYNAMDSTPIGFTYRSDSEHNAQDWDVYWYEKNLQGDIVAIYDDYGTKLISYTYDAWGYFSTTYHNGGASTTATHNRLTYRGYYYDIDLGFYCTGTRYYDPIIGRWISSDTAAVITATPEALTDKNLYAYCDNNPVMRVDHGGEFWHLVIGGVLGGVIGGISAALSGGDVGDVLIGTLGGVASGVLTASGVGIAGQVVGSAIIAMSTNALSQFKDIIGDETGNTGFDFVDMVIDGVVAGVAAGLAGNGASHKNVAGINSAWDRLFERGLSNPKARQYFYKTAHNAGGEFVLTSLMKSMGFNLAGSAITTIKNSVRGVLGW